MEYKVGDKFIIEIEETYAHKEDNEAPINTPSILYRIKNFNSLVFDRNGLSKLEKYDPVANDAAIDIMIEKKYQKGLNEAWEAAMKITFEKENGGFLPSELEEMFGSSSINYIFASYSAAEAISKIKAYEEQKKAEEKVKIGDEIVCVQTKEKGFIVCVQDEIGRTHAMVAGYDCPQVISMGIGKEQESTTILMEF